MKILYLISEDWYFWSHRRSLAYTALKQGNQVTLVTRVSEKGQEIMDSGIYLIPIDLQRSSVNPFHELKTIWQIIRIYKREKPDLVHQVALKPVIYGTLAARLTRVSCIVNALGGLGHIYSSPSRLMVFLRSVFSFILRLVFGGKNIRLILQNHDDRKIVLDNQIILPEKIVIIRGSGADTDYFRPHPEPTGVPIIMYAGRLLWSKGIEVLINAAHILKEKKLDYKMVLVGRTDPQNPESIEESIIDRWEKDLAIEWWGHKDHMAEVLAKSAVVVLPAIFREGLPKVLVEAASSGRPIITSNLPGCKEVVRDRWNGFLVPPGDPEELAAAIKTLLLNKDLRFQMGENGRKLVEEEFSEKIIVDQTFALYKEFTQGYL